MAYSVAVNEKGRYQVISPKGKTWKTTYASQAAADKAIAYIEGRFSSPGAPRSEAEISLPDAGPDTTAERLALGIPAKDREEDDTEGW